ncbi:MAG: helix-turn-helix domain-containing protein [Dorea sp.]|nr:helix-turn-helix domain-containing protein [Dorea sp.]
MEKHFPTIDKVSTGKQIRRLMNALDLTVIDVQKYMGFSTPQAIYHWLNGRSLPTLDNVYALSELFMVPMDQIICGNRVYQPEYGSMYYRIKAYIDFMQMNYIVPREAACI